MTDFHLNDEQRAELFTIIATTEHETARKRAYGIYYVHLGYSIRTAAKLAGIARNTLRSWLRSVQQESVSVLTERPHGGRRPQTDPTYRQHLKQLLAHDPCTYGYTAPGWTVPLLRHHLQAETGLTLSDPRMRTLLHHLGYRYGTPFPVDHAPTTPVLTWVKVAER